MESLEKFIVKETEKAVCLRLRFENVILEDVKSYNVWIPKSVISLEKKSFIIKSWFLKNKIEEMFSRMASNVIFDGLEIVNK